MWVWHDRIHHKTTMGWTKVNLFTLLTLVTINAFGFPRKINLAITIFDIYKALICLFIPRWVDLLLTTLLCLLLVKLAQTSDWAPLFLGTGTWSLHPLNQRYSGFFTYIAGSILFCRPITKIYWLMARPVLPIVNSLAFMVHVFRNCDTIEGEVYNCSKLLSDESNEQFTESQFIYSGIS